MITIGRKKIKVLAIFLILLMAGCSIDGSQDESGSGTADMEVSENQTAVQPEEEIHTLSDNDTGVDISENDIPEQPETEEDSGEYFAMEELKALDIPEDMLAYWLVLNSKMPFVSYDEGNQEFYWDEYFWLLGEVNHARGGDIYWGDPSSFTIVDMNNDGKNEFVVALSFGIIQVLHYEDGVVYGYQFVYRGMCPIYLNGIYAGGSGYYGCYRRLSELSKDGYTEEVLAEAEYSTHGDHNSYKMGDISVSQEEYEEFQQTLVEVGEVEYIDYTEDLLDEHLLAGLSEDELYMVKHVAVEPMTDTAEYPMEPEIMQAYYEVLTGEKEFISATDNKEMFYLNDYHQQNEDQIRYFSIVDMDRDGRYEVVLACELRGTQILHYENGDIYSYQYRDHDIGAIENDGIFSMGNFYYYGYDDDKYGIINSFEEDGCDIEEVDYNGNINDDRIRYYYFSEELIEQYFK